MANIAAKMKVTKKGDSLDNPDIGVVLRVSGNRCEVDWGWATGWETVHSLRPATEKAKRAAKARERADDDPSESSRGESDAWGV